MRTNYYPEKPDVKYQKTSVEMGAVVGYMQTENALTEVKRAAYIVFRNESANGSKGLNNNFVGAQADGARWPAKFDADITGIVTKVDSGGDTRLFLAFYSWKDSVDFLFDRISSRGLYIGGFERLTTKKNITDQITLKDAYAKGYIVWPVVDNKPYKPTKEEEKDVLNQVCLAIAYKRTWVKGSAFYLPTIEEVQSFTSMYRQAKRIFP